MTNEMNRRWHWQRFVGPTTVLLAGLLYATSAARTVQGGDSGEIATAGATGDVLHPPGYPLFLLWLRLFSWLPAESIAHRASLATALSAGLAIALVQKACRAWGASIGAAAVATLIFAVSPIAWRLSTEPEVFMLNVAIAMVILILASPEARPFGFVRTDRQRVLLLALFAGLGLANHHSIVLLAPVGLTAAIAALRRSRSGLLQTALLSLGMLAVGLSPYLYLLYAARHPTSSCTWGDTSTLRGLLHHFLRADYGTFNLAASPRKPSPALNVFALFKAVTIESGGLVLLSAVPCIVAIRKRRRPSILVVIFVVTFLVVGPLFVARFNTYPIGLAKRIVERFYLFPLSILTIFASVGATQVFERYRVSVVALAGILIARTGFTIGERLADAPYRGMTEAYARDVFRIAPPSSILLVSGDDAVGGFFYARCGLHLREDVDVVTPVMLLTDWYWPRVTSQLKLSKPITHGVRATPESEPVLDPTSALRDFLATNRPVLLNEWFARTLSTRFPSYPYGPVIRLVDTDHVPDPDRLLAETDDLYTLLDAPKLLRPPPPKSTWPGARAVDYARPWNVLAEAFGREGDRAAAQAAYCRDRARLLTPVAE
jgi:hypothetical protein